MKVDILAFAAHPDDIELAASGTILKHISQGKKVAVVDLTQGELGSRGTIDTRYEEAANSSKILGLSDRTNLKMRDGFFEITEVNLKLIIEQIRKYQPEIVLMNAPSDRHPDHGRGSQLVSRACFLSGLLKIETSIDGESQEKWRPKVVYKYIQDHYLKPDFCVDITEFADKKIESILAFKTQFYNPDSTLPETPISGLAFLEFVKSRMREFGRPIGAEYAEGFIVERTIGVNDLFDLV